MGKPHRVIVYVDGLNLHNGLLKFGLPRWVDLTALGRNVLRPGQELTGVRYFTSRLVKNSKDQYEQDRYLQALEAQGVEIVLGRFEVHLARCPHCGKGRLRAEEKQTDVNIATRLLTDAHQDLYDKAVLLSGDSDMLRRCWKYRGCSPARGWWWGFRRDDYRRSCAARFRLFG